MVTGMNSSSDGNHARPLPLVCVLLSLYNGERYLGEQLESLARQRDVRIHIEARDDGSSDGSVELFEQTCARLGLSHNIVRGTNVGAAESFFELMFQDLDRFDYVALCDQDDVWREDKLSYAVAALAPLGPGAALYGSTHTLTDEQLNPLSDSSAPREVGFGNAVIENVLQGATVVMNRAGAALIRAIGRPRHSLMHDGWCYLVFSALGAVVFDPRPTILYRQHQNNVVGATHSFLQLWKRRIANHFQRAPGGFRFQTAEFLSMVGGRLSPDKRSIAERLVRSKRSIGVRLGLAFDRRLWRQARLDDLVWRLMILAGRY